MYFRPFQLLSHLLIASTALAGLAWGGPTINATDLKGRSVEIELVSINGENVTFRRAGKEYTLPISQFDTASQERIRKDGASLPAAPLKLTPEVIIGKRRDKGDSYYMVKQTITCTVKLTNTGVADTPPLTGYVIFFGEDRSQPDVCSVLSSQTFEVQVAPGKTFVKALEEFSTKYDSDNKGYGNVGGAQYTGYLLILQDAAGNIVMDQTTSGSIRQALNNKPSLTKTLITYKKDKKISSKLEPLASGQ